MFELDAFDFNTTLRCMNKPSDCADLFRSAIAPFQFDTFSCGEIDLQDRDRTVFYIIDWPERWRRFYVKSGLIDRDPLLDALAAWHQPFTWSDLRADRRVPRWALDVAAAEGWTEGLCVPMPNTGSRIGLVSLVGHSAITPAAVAYLSLISVCLHSHVRTLVAREGFAAPPAGLTSREIDCLRLVARGLTDRAIAASLGIAASTAHEHIEKAKSRLKAKSRAELIAVAVSLAIIDI